MRYMNDYDLTRAEERFGDHPILGPAVVTLGNLMEWANANSDGWAYWPKPARAAAKLMELIEGDGSWFYREQVADTVTVAEYRAALRPIKAFRTRHGAIFAIEEV